MRRYRMSLVRWSIAMGAALAALASPAVAAGESLSVGVAPSLVEFEAVHGMPASELLQLYNDGDVPIAVRAEVFDAGLDSSGRVLFAKRPNERAPWSAADWLAVSEEGVLTLGPGEETEVLLTADPPKGSEPGTHRAVVTFAAVDARAEAEESGLVPRLRVTTLVLVRVPGEVVTRPRLSLDAPLLSLGVPRLRLTLQNDGNVHFFAKGDVTVADGRGRPLDEQALDTPQRGALVLPGGERDFEVRWREAPLLGVFHARARVDAGEEQPLTARCTVLVLRWPMLVAPLTLLALASLGTALSKRYAVVRRA